MDFYRQNDVQIQLHGFCDDTVKDYAAVSYLNVATLEKVIVNLITLKAEIIL